MIDLSTPKFDMSDKNRVERLSASLMETQCGWIDIDIYSKIDASALPPISQDILRYVQPSLLNYIKNNPCYYWITITIPEGVEVDNLYLTKTRSEQIELLNQIQSSMTNARQGESLFYVIDSSRILCLVKINLPCEENIQAIQQKLQQYEDELYKSLSGQVNINWKVSCSKVYEYNDIPVTLKLYEKLMESPL